MNTTKTRNTATTITATIAVAAALAIPSAWAAPAEAETNRDGGTTAARPWDDAFRATYAAIQADYVAYLVAWARQAAGARSELRPD